MASDALGVEGTRLYYSLDGVTYTELTDLQKIGSPGMPDSPEVDATPLADNSGFRQFRLGLATTSTMSVSQFFTKTRMAFWTTYFRTTQLYWRLIYPDNANPALCSKDEFRGWIKKKGRNESANPDDNILIDAEIRITGTITFTAGS